MPTKLVKPPRLEFRPVGSGYPFGDGSQMLPEPDGTFFLPDRHSHYLDSLLAKGWKHWEAPPMPRIFRNELERQVVECPLGLAEIIKKCESEGVKLRVEANKLQTKGSINPLLREYLMLNRISLRNMLEELRQIPWEDV